jgi:hypothetical protein
VKTIEITISPSGEIRVATKGFSGSTCREASSLLERALGQREREELTPDFYEASPVATLEQPQQ